MHGYTTKDDLDLLVGPHNLSDEGLDFIKDREGWRPQMYDDSRGNATIGYGHLIHGGPIGTDPVAEAPFANGISRGTGSGLLRTDVGIAESAVNRLVTAPVSQSQFDALVDFTYNAGQGNFARSTLLQDVNTGAGPSTINSDFMMWGGGARRQFEADMFNNHTYP
jgi:lysozyme